MNTIWLAFITGLTTGGISCLMVQGGLLASALQTNTGEEKEKVLSSSHWQQIGTFIFTKILSYSILGALLGGLGSLILFTPKIMGLIQIFAGLFMVITALRILDIHPIFRYFVIQPPKWAYKFLRKTSVSGSIFAPAMLGFFSVLMPCGVTQAMMVVAVSSGNAVVGGLTMGAFVLGTSPLFFLLGASVAKMLENKIFSYIAAIVISAMGLLSINGGLASRGSLYTFQNLYKVTRGDFSMIDTSTNRAEAPVANGTQGVTITVTDRGYTSDIDTLKVNVPVVLKLVTDNVRSCSRAFTIPEYNISKNLPSTGVTEITFTPTKTGRLAYTCSMGMYTGEFIVK